MSVYETYIENDMGEEYKARIYYSPDDDLVCIEAVMIDLGANGYVEYEYTDEQEAQWRDECLEHYIESLRDAAEYAADAMRDQARDDRL